MSEAIAKFARQLAKAWSLDTSSRWNAARPALGQCSVTALVVQDVFGGELLKTKVGDDWHFYNRIDGNRFDLTSAQFDVPIAYDDCPASRKDAFSDTSPGQYRSLRTALGL
ncbi:MAG: hypothetical protein M9939_10935 [Mesorhizobium sp.]|nr:hypothetical protein [Mesorhizobium sp.]MCO5161643.1 hypothetical protein [Mesorhizobium sp.]